MHYLSQIAMRYCLYPLVRKCRIMHSIYTLQEMNKDGFY